MTEEQVVETEHAEAQAEPAPAAELSNEDQAKQQEEQELREQEETESKPWFQKRINEITRQKYQERERAEAAEKRALELEERITKLEKTKEPQFEPTRAKPAWKDFESQYDDPDEAQAAFAEALTDWKFEQHDAKIRQQREREKKEADQKQSQKSFNDKLRDTVSKGAVKYKDWDEATGNLPGSIQNKILGVLIEIPNGHDVAYYLSKNLQEAEKISEMTPFAMAAELGRIELKLSTTERKQSSAPPPINPLKGKAPATTEIDPGKDPKAWIEARNRGEI